MKKWIITLIAGFLVLAAIAQDNKAEFDNRLTMYDHQRNSIHAGYGFALGSLLYERIIPTSSRFGLTAGGGILQALAFTDGETFPVAKLGVKLGVKHSMNGGLFLAPTSNDAKILPTLGYAYQSQKGFLIRLDLVTFIDKDSDPASEEDDTEIWPLPVISLGYSF